MGRPRKDKWKRLPTGVYLTGGRFVYRQYLGKGKFAPDVRLCAGNASERQVWAAYNETVGVEQGATLRAMFDLFKKSPRWVSQDKNVRPLSPSTKRYYSESYDAICATMVSGRKFGEVPYASVTRGAIQAYVEYRVTAPVLANRQLSAMSAAFKWAANRDMVSVNPCLGVQRYQEHARVRYVTDAEYQMAHYCASKRLQVAMELAYLGRLREIELVALTRPDVRPDGMLAERVKGSKTQLIGYTERLQEALEAARTINKAESIRYILPTKSGGKLTAGGLRTEWQRFRSQMRKNGLPITFTFHDLKAKGVSDFDGSKKLAGGHRTESAAAVYDRRLEIVPATR